MVWIVRIPGLDRSITCIGIGDVNDAAIRQGRQHLGSKHSVIACVLEIILSVVSVGEGTLGVLGRPPQAVAPLLQSRL